MASGYENSFDELTSQALWDTMRKLQQRAQGELQPAVPRSIWRQQTVIRDHVGAAEQLFADYFAEEPR